MSYRAGFIGLIGQPNVGKSTFMNALIEEKVSIVSPKPQTTRRRILGIHSGEHGQIVFVDAPGLIQAEQGLNAFLKAEAQSVMQDSDALIAVLSVDMESIENAEETLKLVDQSGKPWVAIITKVDIEKYIHRISMLKDLVEKFKGRFFLISSTRADKDFQIEKKELLDALLQLLPEAPAPLYDIHLFTPESERELVAEIIREKCFEFLHQEVPFGVAVRVIKYDELAEPIPHLAYEIIVNKESHKGMTVGKGGEVLKKIGTAARKDIEKLLNEKVFLDLKVSVKENWAREKKIMKEMGYINESKK